jgi:hypothetical protein
MGVLNRNFGKNVKNLVIFALPNTQIMKRILLSLVVVAIAAFVFASCASSKRGSTGCPTSVSSNKPFRA